MTPKPDNFDSMSILEMAKTLGEMGETLKTPRLKVYLKVYCVLDDSNYPGKLKAIFAQEKDAKDFICADKDYIVEEFEVIL
jgi:hypothetical protein